MVRQFYPALGGFEDVVLNLARLQRSEWDIDARVVTLDRIFSNPGLVLLPEDEVEQVPVTRIPWRGSSRYPLAPRVLAKLGGCDILHVHAIDFFFDYLALTRPLHRRRLVVSTHGGFFHTPKWARVKRVWFRTLTRASARAYDAVVAVSQSDAAQFKPLLGSKVVQIENGVNLQKYAQSPGRPRHPRRIVTFGRMTRHKRLDRLVALLATLRRHEPGWELVIAGPPGDHPAAELVTAAEQAGCAGSLTIRGALSAAELAVEIAEASWFGSASAFEGFGLAAVEAAGAGLIPVLSNIPPFVKLQAALGAGFIFDPDQPGRIVPQLLEQAARLPDMTVQARLQSGVSGYGVENMAAEYVQLYQQILASNRT
ncbi:MAG: glycosyltransferase family 4 protein [Acetobacteraceae bacterium]|nr:glycosyltransferase family 4 protein [Acetobacteraceae bacterium]